MPGRPCSWPPCAPPLHLPPRWGSEEGVLGGMHLLLLPLPAPRRGFNRTKELGPLGIRALGPSPWTLQQSTFPHPACDPPLLKGALVTRQRLDRPLGMRRRSLLRGLGRKGWCEVASRGSRQLRARGEKSRQDQRKKVRAGPRM